MHYATTSGMVLAAICIGEAVAGPAHAHLHQRAHKMGKKDVDWSALDWNNMGIDWASAYAKGQKSTAVSAAAPAATPKPSTTAAAVVAAPAKTTTTAAAAAATTKASVAADIVSDLTSLLFGGIKGLSNDLTAFGGSTAASGSTGDFYVGNVGVPYGANIIKVASTSGYDFTNTFTNSQKKSITVNVWQKVGPDGRVLSGSALAPVKTTLTFVLAPGASQTIAMLANTQIGWAESCSSIATSGAFATTWGEANFVASGSGYDVSAIMNPNGSNYAMTITSVEAPSCTSSMTENYWLTDTQPIGNSDGSCYIAQSTAHLTTIMGGTV